MRPLTAARRSADSATEWIALHMCTIAPGWNARSTDPLHLKGKDNHLGVEAVLLGLRISLILKQAISVV